MRVSYTFCVILGLLLPGCSMTKTTADNLVTAPIHYPFNVDRCLLKVHCSRLAEDAWRETRGSDGQRWSSAYAKGFKDGFADFVRMGGSGEPPSVPPRNYWHKDTAQGRQAATEWFDGFRDGARLAEGRGHRQLIVIPASAPAGCAERWAAHPLEGREGFFYEQREQSFAQPMPPASSAEDIPVLPAPRQLKRGE